MKAQQQLAEKLKSRAQSFIKAEDEQHKIDRAKMAIEQIDKLQGLSKRELKTIIKKSDIDMERIIAIALWSELDEFRIDKLDIQDQLLLKTKGSIAFCRMERLHIM